MTEATVFDVVVGAAVDAAAGDAEVAAAARAFFTEAERAIPGGWKECDRVHTAAMVYAHDLAAAAFKLGWELRADPDRLRTLADAR